MRRARRADANQPAIVAALRANGRTVEVISDVGRGVPDLLVMDRHGFIYLLEVKAPKAKLTPDEDRWHATWNDAKIAGRLAIVRTEQEALDATGDMQPW